MSLPSHSGLYRKMAFQRRLFPYLGSCVISPFLMVSNTLYTILLPTTTYLEIVVDSYISFHEKYECAPLQSGVESGRSLQNNEYKPQIECKPNLLQQCSRGCIYS